MNDTLRCINLVSLNLNLLEEVIQLKTALANAEHDVWLKAAEHPNIILGIERCGDKIRETRKRKLAAEQERRVLLDKFQILKSLQDLFRDMAARTKK